MPSLSIFQPSRAVGVLSWCLLGVGVLVAAAPPSQAEEPEARTAAVATGSGPLETSITVETLQVSRGAGESETRRWVPAERLVAGDEVYYTVRVRNPGKEPVNDVVVTKRLPYGVRYRPGSATGPACEVQFSSDGGVTFASPEARKGAGQKSARRAAVEYTHVRWILRKPLSPNATALLRFRATFS